MLRQKWLSEKHHAIPMWCGEIKDGIEEINLAMPLRGNAWVVEEGQGADSVQEIIH